MHICLCISVNSWKGLKIQMTLKISWLFSLKGGGKVAVCVCLYILKKKVREYKRNGNRQWLNVELYKSHDLNVTPTSSWRETNNAATVWGVFVDWWGGASVPRISSPNKRKGHIRWKQRPNAAMNQELPPSLTAPSSAAVVEQHNGNKQQQLLSTMQKLFIQTPEARRIKSRIHD